MKRRYYKPYLTACFLSIFIFSFAPKCFATEQPAWIKAYTDGSLNLPSVYYGVGFAPYKKKSPDYDARRLAKNRALDELCYQISVSITSQFKEHFIQNSNYGDQNVSSSLFVSTHKELSGIEEKANRSKT